MKTKSFLLGAAALMLATSCSNDEVVKVAENSAAIGFSSFINKSTRATDNTTDNLKDLKVWALTARNGVNPYAVFGGDLVNKEIVNGDLNTAWKYANTRYWVVGNSYTFTAIAPAEAVGDNVTVGTTMEEGAVKSIAFTNNGKIDLLYNEQEVKAGTTLSDYTTVNFNLGHILSRVRFEFMNALAKGYSIEISDLSITDAKTSGTFNRTKWTVDETTGSINFDFDGAEVENKDYPNNAAAEESAKSQPSYLFPAESKEYELTFKVKLIQADAVTSNPVPIDTYTHKVTLPAQDFKLGYSYAFKTVINAENVDPNNEKKPIEFTASVENWEEEVVNEDAWTKK